MDKSILSILRLFAAVGLLGALGTGYWLLETRAFLARSAAMPGSVVELQESRSRSNGKSSRTWHPVIAFRDPGGQERRFRSSTGSSPPAYRVGEAVRLRYDPAAPSDVRIDGWFELWGWPSILGLLSAVFGAAGGGLLLHRGARADQAARLGREGQPVTTTVRSVEPNRAISMNGAHPWRVTTDWRDPATGALRTFLSENLWSDPTAELRGRSVRVYLDRRRPSRYHMELDFLEELAPPTSQPAM